MVRILQFQYGRKLKVTTLEIHNLNSCSYTWTPSLHSGHFDVFDTKRWDLCFFVHTFSNVILLWLDTRLLILTTLKVLEKYPKISHTHFKPHRLRNIFGLEWPKSHKNAKIENGHFALNIDLSKTRGNKQKTTKNNKNREVWEEFYSTC